MITHNQAQRQEKLKAIVHAAGNFGNSNQLPSVDAFALGLLAIPVFPGFQGGTPERIGSALLWFAFMDGAFIFPHIQELAGGVIDMQRCVAIRLGGLFRHKGLNRNTKMLRKISAILSRQPDNPFALAAVSAFCA